MKEPAVYIISNKKNGAIYTGVTSNLGKRIYEHKEGAIDGFTKNIIVSYWCFTSHMTLWNQQLLEKSKLRLVLDKKRLIWLTV